MSKLKSSTALGALILAASALIFGAALAQDMPPPPRFDFAAMDADKDGQVSKAEAEAYQAAQIAAMDSNGDGKIDADELTAHHMAMMQENMAERAKNMGARMIKRLDTDKDGALSMDEMAARKGGDRMFDRMDENSDGMISQAEAEAAMAHMQGRGGRGDHHKGDHKGGFWGMFGKGN